MFHAPTLERPLIRKRTVSHAPEAERKRDRRAEKSKTQKEGRNASSGN
jgi:hypothetical protein